MARNGKMKDCVMLDKANVKDIEGCAASPRANIAYCAYGEKTYTA